MKLYASPTSRLCSANLGITIQTAPIALSRRLVSMHCKPGTNGSENDVPAPDSNVSKFQPPLSFVETSSSSKSGYATQYPRSPVQQPPSVAAGQKVPIRHSPGSNGGRAPTGKEQQNGNGTTEGVDAASQTESDNRQASPEQENVAAALARAQEALSRVENSLESIEDLPSAKLPGKYEPLFKALRSVVFAASLVGGLMISHGLGLITQWLAAIAGAFTIAWWGYRRSSLSLSGAIAAIFVGAGTLGCSLRFGATLLAFYFSSSKLTSFKEDFKVKLDDSAKAGGQRDWKQVFCNAGVPTILSVAYGLLLGCVDVPFGPSPAMEAWRSKAATLIGGAFLGYYACCCGDTWASELGPLSADTPRLITTMRPVRRGTNGGVTLLGLSASIFGGMFIGLIFYAAAIVSPTLWILEGQQAVATGQWRLVFLGLMAGLVGSVTDSVLGATLQYSGYNRATGRVTSKPGPDVNDISGIPFLDNNMVNLLSATTTAGLTALAALAMFGA